MVCKLVAVIVAAAVQVVMPRRVVEMVAMPLDGRRVIIEVGRVVVVVMASAKIAASVWEAGLAVTAIRLVTVVLLTIVFLTIARMAITLVTVRICSITRTLPPTCRSQIGTEESKSCDHRRRTYPNRAFPSHCVSSDLFRGICWELLVSASHDRHQPHASHPKNGNSDKRTDRSFGTICNFLSTLRVKRHRKRRETLYTMFWTRDDNKEFAGEFWIGITGCRHRLGSRGPSCDSGSGGHHP